MKKDVKRRVFFNESQSQWIKLNKEGGWIAPVSFKFLDVSPTSTSMEHFYFECNISLSFCLPLST